MSGGDFDLAGIELEASAEVIEPIACEINELLGPIVDFKVFEATHYVIAQYFKESDKPSYEKTLGEISKGQEYFFLIIKDYSEGTFPPKYKLFLSIPEVAGCIEPIHMELKALELQSSMNEHYLSSVERVMNKLKEYVSYQVNQCCYLNAPPPNCGGFVCDLDSDLVEKLNFQDQYMVDWFNQLDESTKCEVQGVLNIEGESEEVLAEIRFALYYKNLYDGSAMMRTTLPSIEQCVEDSGIEQYLSEYQEFKDEYQLAFEMDLLGDGGYKSDDSSCFFCFKEKAKQFIEMSKKVYELMKDVAKLQLGTPDEFFIFAEMAVKIVIAVTFIGDIQAIIEGVAFLKEGKLGKGLTFVGLGLVGLAANLASPWVKVGQIFVNIGRFAKKIFNTNALSAVKVTAKILREKLAAGAKLFYNKAEGFTIQLIAGGVKIKYLIWCKLLHKGCFVKDTPVLVDRNAISKSGKVYALAAGLPFMAMPIQEVPLLSWSVANETVNEQNNLIASTDEDLYMGLFDGDPYTSLQQKQRDKYGLNDDDWYSVSFEQVDGTSKCHFALHDDWIKKQGYETKKVVILNLPEQGINGPFRVTAIKHIIPQKKPSEDAGDGYDWKPVTGLFEHQSNQVYNIDFDNGESLGVTYQHPIYSVSAGDWRLAGELEIGEEVLTKSGNTKVVSSSKKEGSQTVYNIEVKELHNFLVGESGIVVHNFCVKWISKLSDDWLNKGAHFNVPLKNGKIEIAIVPDNNGGYLLKKWPQSTKEADFLEGKKYIETALENKDFQNKLVDRVEAAIGYATERGSGKAAEFNFLHQALINSFGL